LVAASTRTSALRVLDDALVRYPVNEPLHLCALRAMSALGRTSDALVAYQGLKNRLSDELGSSPTPELQREFQRLLREASPLSEAAATPVSDDPPSPLDISTGTRSTLGGASRNCFN
jgi:DNA-binding SARP family transcriptional activator